jgi:[FeFe] hydrogenase H-cluster maturation GTPase HydF
MTQTTPKGMRLHIGIFGRRNVGKSSLLNALTGQQTSIVSAVAGTTTDPVEKPMELLPIGPVLFIDTAGIDDEGSLGAQRIQRARQALDRTDLGLLVCAAGEWTSFEEKLVAELQHRRIAVVVVFNKNDMAQPDPAVTRELQARKIPVVGTCAPEGHGIADLREAILRTVPDEFVNAPPLAGDLVPPGGFAVLVVPIDKEAPKGRLILPQVQTIRDLLDNDAYVVVVKERELRRSLENFREPPALVITDSQAFLKVAADTPPSIRMTSFSILMARSQGDLNAMVQGAMAIETLRPGARVLIAEACTHHPITEDIGTVKIPRWLTQFVGGALTVTHVRGHDFPDDPAGFDLVIHCGACMWNRREMLSRILLCRERGVPITNYGLTIAYTLGIFERALAPFPAALEGFRDAKGRGGMSGKEA